MRVMGRWALAVSLALHGGGVAWAVGSGSAPGGSESRRVDIDVQDPAPPLVVETPEPKPEPKLEPKVVPPHHVPGLSPPPKEPSQPPPLPASPPAQAVPPSEAAPQAATTFTVGQTTAADPNARGDAPGDAHGVDGGAPGGSAAGVRGGSAGAQGAGRGVGGDLPVVGPNYDAAYLSNAPPRYPPVARRMKLQGTSTVRVLVGTDGHPQHVRLEKTSGVGILDEAALEAVQGWRFVPARQGQMPVATEVNVPLRFRLEGMEAE